MIYVLKHCSRQQNFSTDSQLIFWLAIPSVEYSNNILGFFYVYVCQAVIIQLISQIVGVLT